MKRLVLCGLAVLLSTGALVTSRPAYACTTNPLCVSEGCEPQCNGGNGFCNACTGRCLCEA